MNKYVVVATYNFDYTPVLTIFDTYEEAKAFLKQSFMNELEIDRENGWSNSYEIDEAADYAVIMNHFGDHDDITEWRIGAI